MIKLASNAFLMTRISFINEIANVCELVGADVVQGRRGHRARPSRRAALPARRHRLRRQSASPRTPSRSSSWRRTPGYHFQLLSAVIEVNELQKRRVVKKLEKHLGTLHGKTIAILGLAFKPNTNDMREAPSLVLASRLLAEGASCASGTRSRSTRRAPADRRRVAETLLEAVRERTRR